MNHTTQTTCVCYALQKGYQGCTSATLALPKAQQQQQSRLLKVHPWPDAPHLQLLCPLWSNPVCLILLALLAKGLTRQQHVVLVILCCAPFVDTGLMA